LKSPYVASFFFIKKMNGKLRPVQVLLPLPGTNWANWSNAMGREMYLRRALDRLNLEYPSDIAS
jgi:hypothetical protein